MVSSNPREPVLWTPRTQEMMGGFSPREMIDHDINPNEDSDGLSHHGRETPEDGESRDQQDSQKRKERAMRELAARIPHVSIKPEKIDDTLGRSPQFEQEQSMLEAGVGMDLNRNGIGLSNGFNAGSVRTEGPNIRYGGSNTLVPGMLGKAIKDGKCSKCGRAVWMPDNEKEFCMMCEAGIDEKESYSPIEFEEMINQLRNSRIKGVKVKDGFDEDWQTKNTSEDIFTFTWDSIIKGKRKYKGRRMYDDEESEEEEKKSKSKRKRKKKRQGKKKKAARGGRQPKSMTTRRAGNLEQDIDRGSKRQAFHPNKHSEAIRGVGRSRTDRIPLRLRDPIAWERKKANERMRRQMGSLPTGLTHHADTRGVGTKGRSILGGTIGSGTKMPSVSRMGSGTSTKRFSRDAVGDPLGAHDPLFAKMNPRLPKAGSLDGVLVRNPDPPTMNAGMPRDPDLLARLKRMHEAKLRAEAQAAEDEEDFDPENSQYGINVAKAKPNLTRAEIMSMKRKIEKLLARLNKLTKATPELGNEGKVGAQANSDTASAPTGATKLNEEEQPYRAIVDMALGQEMGLIGKK